MNLRHTGAGLAAALLLVAVPLTAQTTDAGTAGTAPPRDPQSRPTVTPEQVIGVVKGLIKPKPSPTVFPTPTPAPTPRPTPTPTPTLTSASAVYPAPTPRPVPSIKPTAIQSPLATSAPRQIAAAPAPIAPPSPTPSTLATPVASLPEASTTIAPSAAAEPFAGNPPPEAAPVVPWWLWLFAAAAAGGLAELARRWFWPKFKLGCEIAIGPSALTAATSPAFSAPDITIDIRIEPGEASAPAGHPILAEGGIA